MDAHALVIGNEGSNRGSVGDSIFSGGRLPDHDPVSPCMTESIHIIRSMAFVAAAGVYSVTSLGAGRCNNNRLIAVLVADHRNGLSLGRAVNAKSPVP